MLPNFKTHLKTAVIKTCGIGTNQEKFVDPGNKLEGIWVPE